MTTATSTPFGRAFTTGLRGRSVVIGSRWYCTIPGCDGEPHEGYDYRHARPKQTPPDGDWFIWLILAGRGFGKTRTGAEWLADQAKRAPRTEWAIIAPKFSDVRRVCVEGPSGLIAALGDDLGNYNRSTYEIRLKNGSKVYCFGAEDPMVGPRGLNLSGAWADEIAAWRYPEVWHEALLPAIRVSTGMPHVVVTTTPKMVPLVRDLARQADKDSSVRITRGSTWENAANLSAPALEELRRRYEGTRIGRQELEGELLEDVEGALWTAAAIDADRADEAPDAGRTVVAVDPAGTAEDASDETGIVVARKTGEHAYVLADRSCRESPDGWGRRAVAAYYEYGADRIVAEKNYGGDMVAHTIRTVDPNVPVKLVTASRGKRVRAEPVAALYEQHRVHHVGGFAKLEDQMTMWDPDSGHSPDRMDALVWAVSDLMLSRPMTFLGAA